MNASIFSKQFRNLFSIAVLISSAIHFSSSVSRAQTNTSAAESKYLVSVQDLKIARKGRAAFDKGSQILDKGDATGSIPYLEQAIAQNPEHYMAYYDLGVAYFRLAHQTEAEQAFQKAVDLTKGTFAAPQFGLGAILCQKADFLHAEALLQRAVDLDPGSAVGRYYLGFAQFGLNRLIEAERAMEQALLRNANFAQAYLLLARIHQRQHNLPGMLADLEAYIKIEPGKEQARILAEHIRQGMATDAAVVAAARP
jgi:tetratricopeptide (TPR) repeat protein